MNLPRACLQPTYAMHLAFGCALVSVAAAANQNAAVRRSFDLPAGEARVSLKEFIAQSGVHLLYVADDVAGVQTNAVKGEFTPREAIDRMLADTRLTAVQTSNDAIAVKRAPARPPEPAGKTAPLSPPTSNSPPNEKDASYRNQMNKSKLLTILSGVFALSSVNAGAQTASVTPAAAEETVKLSAFSVTTSRDTGYVGSDTVTAGRMNTTLLKLPADVDVLTRDFLDDIAATSLYDSAQYLTNTYVQQNNGNDYGQNVVNYRGLPSGYNTRNYFLNPFIIDTYIASRVEGSRGPNSIVYADAPMGGTTNTVTKEPEFRNATKVNFRVDSFSGIRGAFDVDRRVTDTIGVRVNAVAQEGRNGIDGYREKRKAIDFAGSYLPWRNAKFRAEAEFGYNSRSGWLPSYTDQYTNWDGNTVVSAPLSANPASSTGLSKMTTDTWTVFPNGQVYNLVNFAQTTGANLALAPNPVVPGVNFRGIAPGPKFNAQPDYEKRFGSFGNLGAYFTQTWENGFALEMGINFFHVNLKGGSEQWSNVQWDVNRVNPDGSTNPYFNQPYVSSSITGAGNSPSLNESYRIGASYRLPVTAFTQTFSLSYQVRMHSFHPTGYRYAILNDTAVPDVRASQNTPLWRIYLNDPGRTVVLPQSNAITQYGWVMSRDTLQRDNLYTEMFATSGSYFHDTLTMVGGVRLDNYINRSRNIATYDARGYPNSHSWVITRTDNEWTGSLGASYFPIKWLGAYYNYSEGFTPNNINQSTSTLAGNYENNPVVAHEEGEGIRFRIWDGRLVGSFGFYQERATNMINSLSTATIDRIWVNLGLPQNQIAGGSTSSYQDTQDYKGRGMELNLTANPSAGLKLIFNYATPTNSPTKINPATKQYVTANLAQWQAYANNSANQFSSQVANDILSLQTAVQTYTDGRELNGTFKYRSNFFGTYTFQEGAWKRFGIGGGANLYGPRLIGNVFNQPFSYIYNSAYQVYNGLLTYSFKWRGHDVKVDLNINNLFDNHDPHFTGTSTYQSVAYRGGFIFLPPRQFVLSTAVSF